MNFCRMLSLGECPTTSLFLSKLTDDLAIHMVGRLLWKYASVLFALMSSTGAGSYCSLAAMRVCSWAFSCTLVSFFCARVVTAIIRISSLMSETSASFVVSRHIAAVACCYTPPWRPMSKSYSIEQRSHRTSLPVASPKFRIHFSARLTVQTVELVPSRYKRRRKNPQKTVRHSR